MRYLISTSTITTNNKNRWLKATIKIDDFRRIPYFCVFSWSEKKFLKRHVQICDTLTISSYNLGTSFGGLGPNVLFREARLVNIHSHVCGNLWGHLFGSNSKLFLYVRTLKITSPLENAHYSQFSSVQLLSRVRLFATPWIAAHQASLSITNSRSSPKLLSIESVMPSSHLILCCPLFLLPPIAPSIRVFSNESTLRMRWPKYWSFSFSIIPSKEIPGLISFRMD